MIRSWSKRGRLPIKVTKQAGDTIRLLTFLAGNLAMPKRLTRSRKKGYRTPEGAVYVGRPTLFGNPFNANNYGHARSVILHRSWLNGQLGDLTLERMGYCPNQIEALHRLREQVLCKLHTLSGKDLICWCPQSSDWCHATTLLDMAVDHAEYERHAA